MFNSGKWLRKGGRYHLCWIADTYPESFSKVPTSQLHSHDIRDLSDHLEKYILSESSFVQKRISLRLSVKLLHGLTKLYHRKCCIFTDEMHMLNARIYNEVNQKGTAIIEFEARRAKKKQVRVKSPETSVTELPDDWKEANTEEALKLLH